MVIILFDFCGQRYFSIWTITGRDDIEEDRLYSQIITEKYPGWAGCHTAFLIIINNNGILLHIVRKFQTNLTTYFKLKIKL